MGKDIVLCLRDYKGFAGWANQPDRVEPGPLPRCRPHPAARGRPTPRRPRRVMDRRTPVVVRGPPYRETEGRLTSQIEIARRRGDNG